MLKDITYVSIYQTIKQRTPIFFTIRFQLKESSLTYPSVSLSLSLSLSLSYPLSHSYYMYAEFLKYFQIITRAFELYDFVHEHSFTFFALRPYATNSIKCIHKTWGH